MKILALSQIKYWAIKFEMHIIYLQHETIIIYIYDCEENLRI